MTERVDEVRYDELANVRLYYLAVKPRSCGAISHLVTRATFSRGLRDLLVTAKCQVKDTLP